MEARDGARTTALRVLPGVALLLALVALAVLRSHAGTRLDGFTVDEPWHVVAGAAYVRHGDFRLNPEHPPLTKLWVGLFMPDGFTVPWPVAVSEKAHERDFVERTMYLDNDGAAAQSRARVAMWTLHGLMLLALGLLLWRTFGLAWAACTLAVLAIEATVAAHLPVVMTDLSLALALAIAAIAAGLFVTTWQWRWAIATGVAMGIALGTKHSALPALAAMGAALVVAALFAMRRGDLRELLRRAARVAVVGVLAVAVLWAQYGLRFHAGPDGSDAFNRAMPDKIADLQIDHWREGIAFADRWRLLPRAYLWGLADTVRAGVEGRGQVSHFVWGKERLGHAPWYTWPSVLLVKLPLAFVALLMLAAALLHRARLRPEAKAALAVLLVACAAHLAALMAAQGTYGGIRHALPLVLAVAIACGAAAAFAWQRRSRAAAAAVALLLAAGLASTLREPRAWEFHNALVGGSKNAYRWFGNEGLDLGQRFVEVRALYDRVIAPSGEPLYSSYWFGERQAEAAGIDYRRRVENLDDDNVAGVYEGFFIYPMSSTLPWPRSDWDPAVAFRDLTLVERLGHIGVWRGRQTLPNTRAHHMYAAVTDYLYVDGGDDFARVAARLEEAAAVIPYHIGVAVELGNAHLRLGDRDAAARAYRRPLELADKPVEALVRAQLESRIAQLAGGVDTADIAPMRNPWME